MALPWGSLLRHEPESDYSFIGFRHHPGLTSTFLRKNLYVRMYEYVCMYVCVYVHMYVCIYVCVNVRMYVCTYVFVNVFVYYVCMYVHMYLWMYVWMYVCIYVCVNVCMCECMYACMYVHMYLCTCVCVYVLSNRTSTKSPNDKFDQQELWKPRANITPYNYVRAASHLWYQSVGHAAYSGITSWNDIFLHFLKSRWYTKCASGGRRLWGRTILHTNTLIGKFYCCYI